MRRLWLYTILLFFSSTVFSQSITSICEDSIARWRPIGPYDIRKGIVNYQGILISAETYIRNGKIRSIYVGSNSSGLFRSNNLGNSWDNLTDAAGLPGMGIQDIAISPSNPDHIVIATGTSTLERNYGQGVLYTKNGGKSWVKVEAVCKGYTCGVMARNAVFNPLDPNNVFITVNQELWITSNFLDERPIWERIWSAPTTNERSNVYIRDIKLHPEFRNNLQLYAACADPGLSDGGAKVYRIDLESGKEIDITPKHKPSQNADVAVHWAKPNRVYVILNEPGSEFYMAVSENGGAQYHNTKSLNAYGMGLAGFELEVSASRPDSVYVGGISLHRVDLRTMKTKRVQGNTHDDVRDLKVLSLPGYEKDVILSANDGGLSINYSGGGGRWTHLNGGVPTGLNISQVYGLDVTEWMGNRLIFGLQDNGTIIWNRPGTPRRIYGGDGGDCLIHRDEPDQMIANYNSGMRPGSLINLNIKRNKNISLWKTKFGISMSPLMFSEYDPNKVLYSHSEQGNPPKFDLMEYDIETNESRNLSKMGDKFIGAFTNSRFDPSLICMARHHVTYGKPLENIVYLSDDTGRTWADVTAGLKACHGNKVSSMQFTPNGELWASFGGRQNGEKVYRSDDMGNSWTNVSHGLPNLAVNDLLFDTREGGRIIAATDGGVFIYDADASTWKCFSGGLPPVMTMDLEIDECRNLLYTATFGRGIWVTTLADGNEGDFGFVEYFGDTIASNLMADRSIRIPANGDLRIEGSDDDPLDILMLPGRKIILAKGAKLSLKNVNLQNDCSADWSIEFDYRPLFRRNKKYQRAIEVGPNVTFKGLKPLPFSFE